MGRGWPVGSCVGSETAVGDWCLDLGRRGRGGRGWEGGGAGERGWEGGGARGWVGGEEGGPGGFGGGFGGDGESESGVESSSEVAAVLLRFLFRMTVFKSVGGVLFCSVNSDWECGGKSCGMMIPTRSGSLTVTGLAGVEVRIGTSIGEVMSVESESVCVVGVETAPSGREGRGVSVGWSGESGVGSVSVMMTSEGVEESEVGEGGGSGFGVGEVGEGWSACSVWGGGGAACSVWGGGPGGAVVVVAASVAALLVLLA